MAEGRPEAVVREAIRLLSEKRIALGLSMKAVADRAGVSHTMVSRIERGLRSPTLDMLLRISFAMEIELWPVLREAETRVDKAN